MSPTDPQRLAAEYGRLLADILSVEGAGDAPQPPLPLSELAVQELWDAGLLCDHGQTRRHGPVRILDFGVWNRGAGPDFCRAEIELNGCRLRGDVEIDPCAQDWERHGHGANPLYNRVALHVVLSPPPEGWFTRNEQHCEVPVLYISPQQVRQALGMAPPLDREMVHLCRTPLDEMSVERVATLLQAAAAHRADCKRKRFHSKIVALGEPQAWFEAWAEALGYSANKSAMVALARRAPLRTLGQDAEAILLGTAGFLVPLLPEGATPEARAYHRSVWDSWWTIKERFILESGRELPWAYAGLRPLNHPHRRVAALAVSALHWRTLSPLLNAAGAQRAARFLAELRHAFWDYHCTLASKPLSRRTALVGQERILDFMVNSVYPLDTAPGAWETYLSLKDSHAAAPSRVQRTAAQLFGQREDIQPLLRHHFARQGLLQIEADFCARSTCSECLFPHQLRQW